METCRGTHTGSSIPSQGNGGQIIWRDFFEGDFIDVDGTTGAAKTMTEGDESARSSVGTQR
ncbi:MAG: hypothetical protein KBB33_05225, partial [Candidatus Cloacimonetes bacterium]|nr:hypothetical protein [Candidatus Cloacimonadota bacterium]